MLDQVDNKQLDDQLVKNHYRVELLNTNVLAINDDFQDSKIIN
jgi:hypothetical protein